MNDTQTTQDEIVLLEINPEANKHDEIMRIASDAFQKARGWVTFHRVVFGPGGVIERVIPDLDDRREFSCSDEYRQLLILLTRSRADDCKPKTEKMITLRLPESLHQRLVAEADDLKLSMNKLCITKVLQPTDRDLVPEQKGRRRGRRAGPQPRRRAVPA